MTGALCAVAGPAPAASDAEIDHVMAVRGMTSTPGIRRQIGCIIDGIEERAGTSTKDAWLAFNDELHADGANESARMSAFSAEYGAVFDAVALDCAGAAE